MSSYFWSLDSKFVLYVQDKGGDENYRLYAVDPDGSGDAASRTRDLTPGGKVRVEIIDLPRSTPGDIIIGINDRRPDLHDVYRLTVATGAKTLLYKNDKNVVGWLADLRGNLRLGVRQTADGGTEILRIDGDALTRIYAVNEQEECSLLRFTPDGGKFYIATNKGEQTDRTQLELFDMKTGTTTLVEKDPENEVDFSTAIFSDVSNELLATVYEGDRMRVYPKQEQFAREWEQLKKVLPPGEYSFGSSTLDENVSLVGVSSDVNPGFRYLFDRIDGEGRAAVSRQARSPYGRTLRPKNLSGIPPRDGLVVPAYLVLPRGVPRKTSRW